MARPQCRPPALGEVEQSAGIAPQMLGPQAVGISWSFRTVEQGIGCVHWVVSVNLDLLPGEIRIAV